MQIRLGNLSFGLPYAKLLPPLTAAEYEALRADIARRGVVVPVVLDEHRDVIDGQHRLKIAAELKLKNIPFEVRPGLSQQERKLLALDLNLNRRHLTRQQLAELAVRLRKDGLSFRQIGQTLGRSHEQVRQDVRRATVNSLTVDLPERVHGRDGRTRPATRSPSVFAKSAAEAGQVAAACRTIPASQLPGRVIDAKKLKRLIRQAEDAKDDEATARDVKVGRVTLLHGDFRQRGTEIPDSCVDVIFTDPPYAREFLPLWPALGEFAARVLKRGGVLLTYSGQAHLPEVIQSLGEHLQYVWTCAVDHKGGATPARWDVRLRNVWKPVLLYAKRPVKPTWKTFLDSISHGSREKAHHAWQQSEAEVEYFLRTFCRRGGLVVDPMIGSGTTAVVAQRLGMRCVGIEIGPVALAAAHKRLGHP